MNSINVRPGLVLCMTALILFSGCQSFTRQFSADKENGFAGPASKLTPRSIEQVTGETPLAASDSDLQAELEQAENPGKSRSKGISLDDVSLSDSDIHVEEMDIEDIEEDARNQLPPIVESAVHPQSLQSEPVSLTDQTLAAQDFGNSAKEDLVDPADSTLETTADATHDTSVAANPNHPSSSRPEQDNTTPAAARLQDSGQSDGSDVPIIRITAAPDDGTPIDRSSNTDHLFSREQEKPAADQTEIVLTDTETPPVTITPESSRQPVPATPQPAIEEAGEQVAQASRIQPVTWNQQLDDTIQILQQQLQEQGDQPDEQTLIRLQLLNLAAGRNPDAQITNQWQDQELGKYWHKQLAALDVALTPPDSNQPNEILLRAAKRRQFTQAAGLLEQAQDHLSNVSLMTLSRCAFANEVRGFGQYAPANTQFASGQQVLIYCEIENYSLRETDYSGQIQFVAELQGQFSIIDQDNRVVFQHQFQPVKDRAQRRRNDFYMFFPVTVPELAPGQYRLHLTVEDLVGDKIASNQDELNFSVAGGPVGKTAARTPVTIGDTVPAESNPYPPRVRR